MKIFCISIYNENYSFFKKNGLVSVGLGNNNFDKCWINDKFEKDISIKNKNFGEYTFHYKLWKNLLNEYKDEKWIGFCTYRRFWVNKNFPTPKNKEELSYSILKEAPTEWDEYDCILAEPIVLGKQKFMKLFKKNISFDIIYIDGSHNGEDILSDAIESYKLLNIGGIIIFDDVVNSNKNISIQSYKGFEKFCETFNKRLKVLYLKNIAVVKKIK